MWGSNSRSRAAHKAARIQVAVKNLTLAEGRMMQGS